MPFVTMSLSWSTMRWILARIINLPKAARFEIHVEVVVFARGNFATNWLCEGSGVGVALDSGLWIKERVE